MTANGTDESDHSRYEVHHIKEDDITWNHILHCQSYS